MPCAFRREHPRPRAEIVVLDSCLIKAQYGLPMRLLLSLRLQWDCPEIPGHRSADYIIQANIRQKEGC